jgi:hypothetical protein
LARKTDDKHVKKQDYLPHKGGYTRKEFMQFMGEIVIVAATFEVVSLVPFLSGCVNTGKGTVSSSSTGSKNVSMEDPSWASAESLSEGTSSNPSWADRSDNKPVATTETPASPAGTGNESSAASSPVDSGGESSSGDAYNCTSGCIGGCTECTDSCTSCVACTECTDSCTSCVACTGWCIDSCTRCVACTGWCIDSCTTCVGCTYGT